MKMKYCIGFFLGVFLFISIVGIGYQISYQYLSRKNLPEQVKAEQEPEISVKPYRRLPRRPDERVPSSRSILPVRMFSRLAGKYRAYREPFSTLMRTVFSSGAVSPQRE